MTTMNQTHEQEVDARIADLQEQTATAQMMFTRSLSTLHSLAGDKRVGGDWQMTREQVLAYTPADYAQGSWDAAVAKYAAAREAFTLLRATVIEAEAAYTGWSRFYLVTNANGHIHSSTRCATCTNTTSFAWLTNVSGLNEADAVALHGERLCSVCFPSAPVEWVEGYQRKSREQADAARSARAEIAAAKAAKKAAYWAVRHYSMMRVRDGFVSGLSDWQRAQQGQTLSAARRDAADYSVGTGERWIAIDLQTGKQA